MLTKKDLEHEGREIYQTNKSLALIAEAMEHPLFEEFAELCQANPATWTLANLYRDLKIRYPYTSSYERIAMLKKLIDDKETRQMLFNQSIEPKALTLKEE
jgi:hypothetical protein